MGAAVEHKRACTRADLPINASLKRLAGERDRSKLVRAADHPDGVPLHRDVSHGGCPAD